MSYPQKNYLFFLGSQILVIKLVVMLVFRVWTLDLLRKTHLCPLVSLPVELPMRDLSLKLFIYI